MKKSAWALTNLSNPFQHGAAFSRPLLYQSLRGKRQSERERECVCVCVCQQGQVGISEGHLRVTRRMETEHKGCSVWSSARCRRAIIYPPNVWVTYQRLLAARSSNYWTLAGTPVLCVSCRTFPMKWMTPVFIWLWIIAFNAVAGGASLTAPTAACCLSGRCVPIYEPLILLYDSEKTRGQAA